MPDQEPVQVTPRPAMTDADVPTLVDMGHLEEPPVPSADPPYEQSPTEA